MNRIVAAAPLLLLVAAGPGMSVKPGKWETTVTILDMNMPGVPAGIAQMMRSHPITATSCVTPEQAADGPRSVLQNSKGKCHYASFNVTGGRFDSVLECVAGSGTMTTTSSGSFTATSLDATGNAVMTGSRPMTTKSHAVAHYVGPC